MEAITKFGTVLTQAYQDTSREWYGLAQKQWQRNIEGLSKLAQCRSVQDFTAVQSGLVRESLQHMVEDTRAIVKISLKAVNDAKQACPGWPTDAGCGSDAGALLLGATDRAIDLVERFAACFQDARAARSCGERIAGGAMRDTSERGRSIP